ncbi:YgiQ family radical SAM protein [Methanomethylovorans sp.]|uniref:YgiQ family radical SAM protein n=1 Tax=Methanomethylovorans sp. TaxID=2758717 RepID=UPI000B3339F9|nr:YgiQ family radical SAM protein [Methanomethylovorans sp.]
MDLKEAQQRGWEELDVVIVTGDAYVDHPGFGTAIIGRVLEDAGYRVGIIAQPKWNSIEDFKKLGKPRLFFAISGGNTDSMVSNYTPSQRLRHEDAYSPGNRPGMRPNRATIVFSNRLREAYPDVPQVMGGIEASLRRFAQYDYWSDKVRQSVLADTPADLLVYGMGELQLLQIAERLDKGVSVKDITDIDGTVWKMEVKIWKEKKEEMLKNNIEIPSYTEVLHDKTLYSKAFKLTLDEQDPVRGRGIVQVHPKTVIVQNKPMRPLNENELDHVYELPYTRNAHPSYKEPIPALDMARFSITTHRGCFGSCSFCAITLHQGRAISSRSIGSIMREAEKIKKIKGFKGIINGLGGPSANMYGMKCEKWEKRGTCTDKLCIFPKICPSLNTSHEKLIELMRRLREIPGISKVFVGYGVRYDLALLDEQYMEELCTYHVSGQLKVAPEHYCNTVTDTMKKPRREVFEKFEQKYKEINRKLDKDQYLVAFLMSSHPGCTLNNMIEMAEYIRDTGRYTEQVQDFTPTPMTAATCMFHTGIDPFTGNEIYVATSRKDKMIQRAFLRYKDSQNQMLVYEGLKRANRPDLIGNSWNCLIRRPPRGKGRQ